MNLKSFRGMLLNGDPGGFVFFRDGLPESWSLFFLVGCDLHRNCSMVVILLSFLCNNDNLTLKLHQKKRSYPGVGLVFIDKL